MRIPWRFLLASAAAVALGGTFLAPAAAVAASVHDGAPSVTVHDGVPSASIGSLLASLPDPAATENDVDGASVAVSGNLAAVGNGGVVEGQNGGVVYLYQHHAFGWSATPKVALRDPEGSPGDGFGGGLAALGGTTVVVGSPNGGTSGGGAVYVYTRTASGWPANPTVTLQDPDATSGDEFGWSVAVSKTAIVVGSPGTIGNGTEYVYLASNGTWPTTPTIISPNPEPSGCTGYGTSVAISGAAVVIGCPGSTTSASLAFIEHIAGQDGRNTVIVRTLPDPGATGGDLFGSAVAISGNNIVVGGVPFTGPHNVYVYTRATSGWPSAPTATIPDPGPNPLDDDNFGMTVSISGAVIAVGDNFGDAYLYGMLDGAWVPAPEATVPDPAGDPEFDIFGQAVSVSGPTLLVGAPDTNNAAGAAYLFSS